MLTTALDFPKAGLGKSGSNQCIQAYTAGPKEFAGSSWGGGNLRSPSLQSAPGEG